MAYRFSVRLLLRIFSGCTLIALGLEEAQGRRGPGFPSLFDLGFSHGLDMQRLAFSLLLCVLGAYLVLGICTRVIALFSTCVITLGLVFAANGAASLLGLAQILHVTLLLGSLQLLIALGGGPTALFRPGWRVLRDLV